MLTVRSGYAILALACLHGNADRWVLAQEIAARTNIPKPYLHKILHALGKAGVIQTKRGYRGGISLSKPADEFTILDLVNVVEGTNWTKRCLLGLSECSDARACPTHEFWKCTRVTIEDKLNSITLADVADFESGKEDGRLKNVADIDKKLWSL